MSSGQIDSHQHFWRVSRGDYPWLTPDLDELYRDFTPSDLEGLMEHVGVERTILVQAAPTLAESRYLLQLAGSTSWVAGVVGWVDLSSRNALEQLDALVTDPALRGVRPMVQDIPDPDWLLGESLRPALRALVERDLCFDALVRPVHLPRLLALLEQQPDLRCVIDHGAKPDIARGAFEPWASDIARVARETGARCKLSGLVTEAAQDWTLETLRPYVDHLLASFGCERIMWGSDWPVVNLAGGYDAWRRASEILLAPLSADERTAVLGGTAGLFYRV